MPFFLFHGKYINQGAAGLLQEGGSQRETAIRGLVESVGGTCHSVFFGTDSDAHVIAELPNVQAATFLSMAWNATGRLSVQVSPLLTPSELDQVTSLPISPDYHAPGKKVE